MANIVSFFNKSSFAVSALQKNLQITKDIEFATTLYITDLIKGGTASSVSSTFKVKNGRNETLLADSAVWTSPVAQTAESDLLVTVSDIVHFVTQGSGSTDTILAVASSTSDVVEATIAFSIDDTTNYSIDSDTGEITLTAAGVILVDAGNTLPTYIVTATSDTGAAVGSTIAITPLTAADTVEPYELSNSWPVNAWTLTATIADAAWSTGSDLFMDIEITDSIGEVSSVEFKLVGEI